MFRIKFPDQQREIIKQTLQIRETDPYDIVLCNDVSLSEPDKINLVFQLADLPTVKEKIQFFTHVSPITLVGKTHRGEVRVDIAMIRYIESFGNDVTAYLEKQQAQLPEKLYEIAERLEPFGFFRISKSQIVNVAKIEAIKSALNGKLLLSLGSDTTLEVNRSYTKAFKAYLKGR